MTSGSFKAARETAQRNYRERLRPLPSTLAERRAILARYLTLGCVEGLKRSSLRPHWRFGTYEALVAELGVDYIGAPLADVFERGPMKACVQNTIDVVRAYPEELTFVEGYAVPPETSFPVMHAWAIATESAIVVDPTWETSAETAYRGIPFALDDVERLTRQGRFHDGFFASDYEDGFPLLRTGVPFPPPEGGETT